jgi:antitoxin component YwqK of YwqJK toxin-antitoxin module
MERPANLPSDAIWSDSDGEWIVATTNAAGEYHGIVTYFRPAGTKCCETDHENGTPHGAFRRCHESGEVSREGKFVRGKLHGLNAFIRSESETTEQFPPGLSAAVWRCEMDYENNKVVGGRLFDKAGKRVREDGSAYPDKPPSNVPASAHFGTRAKEPRWIVGVMKDENDGTGTRIGTWRYYTEAGVLACEEIYEAGEITALREMDEESGALLIERQMRGGKPHGAYSRKVQDGDYTVDAAREEGQFEDGTRVGEVKLLDAAGKVVRVIDLGKPSAPETFDEIARAANSTDFTALANRLASEHQTAAVLMAASRAAAAKKDATDLAAKLKTLCVPAPEESVGQITHMAIQVANNMKRFGSDSAKLLKHYFGQIVLGASAPDLLSQAAVALDQNGDPEMRGTACDLIDVAIRLDPSRVEMEFSRALILMSCGRPNDSREAMKRLATKSEEQAKFLGTYLNALFPRFDVRPKDDERVAALPNIESPRKIVRSRADAFAIASTYAARIAKRRAAIAALTEDASWLPPTLSGYDAVEIEDEIEGSIPALAQSMARDWLCLSWMCWLSGSDTMQLSAAFGDRPVGAFTRLQAMRVMVLEGNEVEDDLAMQATFAKWNGVLLTKMPDAFGEMAMRDESELLGMATWLVDENCPSPVAAEEESDEDESDEDDE